MKRNIIRTICALVVISLSFSLRPPPASGMQQKTTESLTNQLHPSHNEINYQYELRHRELQDSLIAKIDIL